MKLKILEERYNKALERKDVEMEVEHFDAATPSKAQIQELVAKHFKANKENVEVMKIDTDSGKNSSLVSIKIWDKKKVDVSAEKKEETAETPEEPKEAPEKPEEKTEAEPKESAEAKPAEAKPEDPEKSE